MGRDWRWLPCLTNLLDKVNCGIIDVNFVTVEGLVYNQIRYPSLMIDMIRAPTVVRKPLHKQSFRRARHLVQVSSYYILVPAPCQ